MRGLGSAGRGPGTEVHAVVRTARVIVQLRPALGELELKEPQGIIPPPPHSLAAPTFCRQKRRSRAEKWLAQGHLAIQ